MKKSDWIVNLENAASRAAEVLGNDAVMFAFRRYDAHSMYDLNPCYYNEVFANLEIMAKDS